MTDRVKLEVKYYKGENNGRGPGYEFSHSYPETWEKIDMYCPNCGKQEVWKEDSAGDYYVGEGFMCVACENEWTIQGPHDAKNKRISMSQGQQRLDAIRTTSGDEGVTSP
jgi:hypothetical protein